MEDEHDEEDVELGISSDGERQTDNDRLRNDGDEISATLRSGRPRGSSRQTHVETDTKLESRNTHDLSDERVLLARIGVPGIERARGIVQESLLLVHRPRRGSRVRRRSILIGDVPSMSCHMHVSLSHSNLGETSRSEAECDDLDHEDEIERGQTDPELFT